MITINVKEKSLQEKVFNVPTAEKKFNPGKYQF